MSKSTSTNSMDFTTSLYGARKEEFIIPSDGDTTSAPTVYGDLQVKIGIEVFTIDSWRALVYKNKVPADCPAEKLWEPPGCRHLDHEK